MPDPLITISALTHEYLSYEKSEGLVGAIRDFFNRKASRLAAMVDVSLAIDPGEMVGLLGPNGAGKTTLTKILAGLIQPTRGSVQVMGCIPHQKSNAYLTQIGLVLGQKSQLMWDLPPADTLAVLKEVYRVGEREYRERLTILLDLLGISAQLHVPVRKLSLGQRMKFELVAALLHRPRLLLLDEPTIGLDIPSQRAIHGFLRRVNREFGTTIILTSHYARDIEALADRLVILQEGRLRYDGPLASLLASHQDVKLLRVETDADLSNHPAGFHEEGEGSWACEVLPEQLNQLLSDLADTIPLRNVSTTDKPLEDVLYALFSETPGSEVGQP